MMWKRIPIPRPASAARDTCASMRFLHLARALNYRSSGPLMMREALREEYRRMQPFKKPVVPKTRMEKQLRKALPRRNREILALVERVLDHYFAISTIYAMQRRDIPEEISGMVTDAFNAGKKEDAENAFCLIRSFTRRLARQTNETMIRVTAAQLLSFLPMTSIFPILGDGDYQSLSSGHVDRRQFDDPMLEAKAIRFNELFFLLALALQEKRSLENSIRLLQLLSELQLLTSLMDYGKTMNNMGKQRELLDPLHLSGEAESVVALLNSNGYFVHAAGGSRIISLVSRDNKVAQPTGRRVPGSFRLRIPITHLLHSYPYQGHTKKGSFVHRLEELAYRLLRQTRIIRNQESFRGVGIYPHSGMDMVLLAIHEHEGRFRLSWSMERGAGHTPITLVERKTKGLVVLGN